MRSGATGALALLVIISLGGCTTQGGAMIPDEAATILRAEVKALAHASDSARRAPPARVRRACPGAA